MLLKCKHETASSLFSHLLKTDMPGTSPQTRLRLSRHFETNVMFCIRMSYTLQETVNLDTNQPGKQQPADIQAGTWFDNMCMRLTWIPSPVPRTENEYVSSQRFVTTTQLVINCQKHSQITLAVVCREFLGCFVCFIPLPFVHF